MSERQNDYCCTGWTPTPTVKLANAPEMRSLCDELLRRGHKDAAIALDNAIDLIREAIAQEFTDASELAPAMTFENGEAQEVQPYHSDNGTQSIPF